MHTVPLVFALAASLEPSILRLVPPDAGFLLGIEVRQVLDSASGGVLQKRVSESGLDKLTGLAAFEKALREDVDALLFVGTAKDVAPGPRQTSSPLVIVRGRFDHETLRKWLPGRIELYQKYEMLAPGNMKPPTSRLVMLDAGTLVFGERKVVVAALDRLGQRSVQVPARLVQRAGELAGRHQIWLALEAPPGGFPANEQNPQSRIIQQLTGLDVGVSFGDGLNLVANLEAQSPAGARDLAAAIQGLAAMAAMGRNETPEAAELVRKLQITQAESGVGLRLALTKAELEQAMTRRMEARADPSAPRPAARPAAAPQAAKPSEPRRIRIIGADQGVREIPVR